MSFKSKDINEVFANLDEKVDFVFRNQMIMSVYQSLPKDYDGGLFINEIEAHILGFIHRKPGITAKEICKLIFRTKGTVSTMLSHLEEEGYVEQRVNQANQKERNLFLTSKGERAHQQHILYDRRVTSDFIIAMSQYCTPEEIDGYFKVIHYRTKYFEQIVEEQKTRYTARRREKKEQK